MKTYKDIFDYEKIKLDWWDLKSRLSYKTPFRQIGKAWYWFRAHTYNRYHIIDISGEDEYRWGWIDRDHVMFLACFKILREFVEKEDPNVGLRTIEDYAYEGMDEEEKENFEKGQLAREREIRDLYYWWVYGRKKEHDKLEKFREKIPHHDYFGEGNVMIPHPDPRMKSYMNKLQKLEEKDDKMLIRLMKIRKCLWT